MYIQRNRINGKNGKVYTATFLCSKYREEGNVKTKVIANLSAMPDRIVPGVENMLKSAKEDVVLLKDIVVSKCVDYGYLKHKKEQVDSLLESISTSWKSLRYKNMENTLALQKEEKKSKKLKTEFSTKDIDSFKRRVYRVL